MAIVSSVLKLSRTMTSLAQASFSSVRPMFGASLNVRTRGVIAERRSEIGDGRSEGTSKTLQAEKLLNRGFSATGRWFVGGEDHCHPEVWETARPAELDILEARFFQQSREGFAGKSNAALT